MEESGPKKQKEGLSYKQKNGTISYNPKQNGSKTENYGKTRKYVN